MSQIKLVHHNNKDRLSSVPTDLIFMILNFLSFTEMTMLKDTNNAVRQLVKSKILMLFQKRTDITTTPLTALWFFTQLANPRELITMSHAIEFYRVPKARLTQLKYKSHKIKYGESYTINCKLYIREQILKLSIKRFKDVESLIIYKQKLLNKRSERALEKRTTKLEKFLALEKEMDKIKIPIKPECKLISDYLNSDHITLEYAVRRSAEVFYLFNYCDIRKVIKKIIEELRKKEYYTDISKLDLVKQAEKRINVEYPQKWPWLI